MNAPSQLAEFADRVNQSIGDTPYESKPVLVTGGTSADLDIVSVADRVKYYFYSQFVDETPFLEGEYPILRLIAHGSPTSNSALRIAGMISVEQTPITRSGYVGVDLNAESVKSIASRALDMDPADINLFDI